jgi:hypothetical protein
MVVYHNEVKMNFNTTKTFKTNDDLYESFLISCKLNRKKVFERINELMIEDVKKSPINSVNQSLFNNTEDTPKESAGACTDI